MSEEQKLSFPDSAKRKSKLREHAMPWIGKVLIVIIPAYFTYLTAKSDAETKARSLAKENAAQVENKAEAGYEEMVKAVKHLDEELAGYRKELYEMKGHITALELYLRTRPTGGRPRADYAQPEPAPAPPEASPLNLAPDLDSAAQKRIVPKK